MQSTILPADRFIIINKTIFNDNDRKILMRLYQPIIGADSVSLYFNLWSELDKNELMSTDHTHHYLINLLGFSIDGFVLAKAKLEAVGLIRTYLKEESINTYIYELYSPLNPNDINKIKDAITNYKNDITFDIDEVTNLPKDKVKLEGEDLELFQRALNLFDEVDDVANVYHNVEL